MIKLLALFLSLSVSLISEELDEIDKEIEKEIESILYESIRTTLTPLNERQWMLESEEAITINVLNVHVGEGIFRPRQIVIEKPAENKDGWQKVTDFFPGRASPAVITFPEMETKRLRLTVPWGKAHIEKVDAFKAAGVIKGITSSLFRIFQPGGDSRGMPLQKENEFTLRIQAHSSKSIDATIVIEVVHRLENQEKIIATTEKPVALDPGNELSESLLLKCGKIPSNVFVRFQLRPKSEFQRPYHTLEYPAYRAPRLTARLIFPSFRNCLFATQKTDEIEVEGLLAEPKNSVGGPKGYSVRLAIGRREFPYRLKEYRTTGMRVMKDRRPILRMKLKDTPAGSFKLRVTIHTPPVFGQAALAQDEIQILSPSANEVWLDRDGRIHVNGQPFFPLGFHHVPKEENAFEEIAKSAANIVHCADATSESLKLAGKHGLKVIAGLGVSIKEKDREASGKRLQQRLSQLRDSPHLLAWSMEAKTGEELASAVDTYRFLRKEDPYHPVLLFQHVDVDPTSSARGADLLGGLSGESDAPAETLVHYFEECANVSAARGKGVVAALPVLPDKQLQCVFYGAIASGVKGILVHWKGSEKASTLIKDTSQKLRVLLGDRKTMTVSKTYPFHAARFSPGRGGFSVFVNSLPKERNYPGFARLSRISGIRNLSEQFQPWEVRLSESGN